MHPVEKRAWKYLGIGSLTLVATFFIGVAANEPMWDATDDDEDCREMRNLGQYDEPSNPNCYQVCKTDNLWFQWGEKKSCRWDD